MFCNNCGFECKEDSKFCDKCGKPLLVEGGKKKLTKKILIGLGVLIAIVIIIAIVLYTRVS
jgi:predicted nucleic acid-binding Zn ribbon protein